MSEINNQTGFFSLADLAAMNTDNVKELTSLIPAIGVYRMRGVDVKAGQREAVDDKPPLYFVNFQGEIQEVKLANKEIDPATLVGRKLTDSFTLWPAQFSDLLGILKGRYKAIGIPNTGTLGGVEGQPPGWLDNFIGADYVIKITHYTSKGIERANFQYMDMAKLKAGEEATA